MSKCKKQVRCTMCTQHRWKGNSSSRFKKQPSRHKNPNKVLWEDYTPEETLKENSDGD